MMWGAMTDRWTVPAKSAKEGGRPAAPPGGRSEGARLAEWKWGAQERSRVQIPSDLESALNRVHEAAVRDSALQIGTLWCLVCNRERVREAHLGLKRNAAPDVIRVTREGHGRNLGANLLDLSERLKRGALHATYVSTSIGGKCKPIFFETCEVRWRRCLLIGIGVVTPHDLPLFEPENRQVL